MTAFLRSAAALGMALALSACLLTPGKFDSSLDIRANGQFSFAYKGEILASDLADGPGLSDVDLSEDAFPMEDEPSLREQAPAGTALHQQINAIADEETFGDGAQDEDAHETRQMQAIAAAFAKEKGFRSVRYMGKHRFEVDYAISGTLDHGFLFPFNLDARTLLPFVAVELRSDGRVRVKAPAFANDFAGGEGPGGAMGGAMGGPRDNPAAALDGRFTLTTDAEIVSQNQEDGVEQVLQGKRIVWTVTPLTSDAPVATLRLKQ